MSFAATWLSIQIEICWSWAMRAFVRFQKMSTFRIWKALRCIFILLTKFVNMAYWWTSLIVIYMCSLRDLSSLSLSWGNAFMLWRVRDCYPSIELELLKWYFSGMKVFTIVRLVLVWFIPDCAFISWLWSWRCTLISFIQRPRPLRASSFSLLGSIGAISSVIGVELHSEWYWTTKIGITG